MPLSTTTLEALLTLITLAALVHSDAFDNLEPQRMATGLAQLPRTYPPLKNYKTIGLISDTHVPSRAKGIPQAVFTCFENVDYIIHAGDLVEFSVVDELEQLAPVLAVHGNMDSAQTSRSLPELNSLKMFEWNIGVIHDPGTMPGMGKVREIVKRNSFDVLVYGHTHAADIKWEDKVLYINPGSPTNPEPPFITKPSVGLLKVSRESIVPEIVQIQG